MPEIEKACVAADIFVAIGTSGVVYPAAGLVSLTSIGCDRVLLNKEEAENNPDFEKVYLGPAGQIVSEFFGGLL